MTMRDESMKGTAGQTASGSAAADAVEQRVLAFAEQLGRIVGSVQAKAEGWLDRDALNAQISTVRDSASELLEHLGVGKQETAASGAKGGSSADTTAARTASSQTAAPKPSPRDKQPSSANRAMQTSSAKPDKQPSSSNRDKQASSSNRDKQTSRPAQAGGGKGQAGGSKAQAGGSKQKTQGAKPAANARSVNTGRSGGVVDAPGKRHRKAAPNQAMPKRTESPVAPIKIANANRSRGRG
jgi:hypothetical protein